MTDRVLRDHSQPCEHEFFEHPAGGLLEGDEVYREEGLYYCHVDGCPGGREVTIDEIREAAYQIWLADQRALITEALVTETADFDGWEAASDG